MTELLFRFSRAQLVAMDACAGGMQVFDHLASGGEVVARSEKEVTDLIARIPPDWVQWIGLGYGYGYGYGYGSGSGSGYGYGDSDGSGYGSGDGYGDGDGSGEAAT